MSNTNNVPPTSPEKSEPEKSPLWKSEQGYRALATNLPGSAVFIVDHDLRYLLADGESLHNLGFQPSDFEGKTLFEATDPAQTAVYEPLYRKALAGEPFTHDLDAYGHSFQTRGVPLRDERGHIYAVMAVSYDATERRQTEEALRLLNEQLEEKVRKRTQALQEQAEELARTNELRQDLLRRLVRSQEMERRRISRELHDQTGQHLTGLALGLKALEENISDCCPGVTGAEAILRPLRTIAEELARDLHSIAVELRPTALDDLGLVPALQTYIERWSAANGIPAKLDSFGIAGEENRSHVQNKERLPEVVETTVYRIVQEALTNTARHGRDPQSRSTRVDVILQRFDGRLIVTIEDNGPGFDVESAQRLGRLGLVGMQERAESCGGTLEIESEPGEGTTVILRIPVKAP